MAKLITYDVKPQEVNGIKINSSIPCNAGNYSSASSRSVAYITVHYTANDKDTAKGNATYFHNNTGIGASAHFFVDNFSIYESVKPVNRAYHCGTKGTYTHPACRNNNSVGIEMCCSGNCTVSEKTKENAAYLVAWWCNYLGIAPKEVDIYVLRHYDVTGKICPLGMTGKGNAAWKAFKDMVRSILQTGSTGKTATEPQKQAVDVRNVAGVYPNAPFRATVSKAKVLNVRNGAGVDGHAVVRQLKNGDAVTVKETSPNGWGRIGDNEWISLDYCEIRETMKPVLLIAQMTLDGRFGNGDERITKLTAAGYDTKEVQSIVDRLVHDNLRVQVVVNTALSIRQKPDNTSKKLDVFGPGVIVNVEQICEGPGASCWLRIGDGWISADYVRVI